MARLVVGCSLLFTARNVGGVTGGYIIGGAVRTDSN